MNIATFQEVASQKLAEFNAFIGNAKNAQIYQNIFDERQYKANNAYLHYYNQEFNGMIFVKPYGSGFVGVGFANRSKKPSFNYYFRDFESFVTHCTVWMERFLQSAQAKAKRKAEVKAEAKAFENAKDYLKIDDIFVCSWGYEQTNIDYYQIIGFKGKKTAVLRRIKGKITKFYSQDYGECVPSPNEFINDDILEKRISFKKTKEGFKASFSVNSYSNAYLLGKDENGEYMAHTWSSYY